MRNFFIILTASLGLSSCHKVTTEEHNKSYVLTVPNGSTEAVRTFRRLIDEFNDYTGLVVLEFTEDASEANSPINLVPNLNTQSHGKIGWGQWKTETTSQEDVNGNRLETTRQVNYSMQLDLDNEYVTERLNQPAGSWNHYELQKLVFHEIGHGLQMPHHSDVNHLMYYEVSGSKDLKGFFDEVADFFDPERESVRTPATPPAAPPQPQPQPQPNT